MKFLKAAVLLVIFPLLIATVNHKFYVSTTNIEYVKEKQTIQVISKIFIEDIEQALQARYNPTISLSSKKETEADQEYLKKYVLQKMKIIVNGKPLQLIYIGKEYDIDIVNMYFEVAGVPELNSIEIENKVLFDMFPEQQNIIHLKTSENRRSLVLDRDHPKGVLNFN
ncbi:MAG: hypothetical protein L3J09_03675 [Flavobacteriaceae bacterium]|nr:hypothetical protein [Flavobacteriaceae bacterium]